MPTSGGAFFDSTSKTRSRWRKSRAPAGFGLRTLQRWKANFQAHGSAGLVRESRSDHGTRRLDDVLVKQIEDMGLAKPRASIATIHRVITKIADEQGTAPPSYSTVRNIITALDPGLRTLALDGPTSYRDKYELAMRRRAGASNAIWQSDHTMLDILIRGCRREQGQARRRPGRLAPPHL